MMCKTSTTTLTLKRKMQATDKLSPASFVSPREAVAHYYKSEYPKLIAVILKLLGSHQFEVAQDIVHDTFNKASVKWLKQSDIPDSPAAWLMTVAKRHAIDHLRRHNKHNDSFNTSDAALIGDATDEKTTDQKVIHQTAFYSTESADLSESPLRLLSWIASSGLKTDLLMPLLLKVVLGLNHEQISRALVISVDNTRKRIYRATQFLQKAKSSFGPLSSEYDNSGQSNIYNEHSKSCIHKTLYLLFNEGLNGPFQSSDNQHKSDLLLIEAINLAQSVSKLPNLKSNESNALCALILFGLARHSSRVDAQGALIPINLQDRSLWKNRYLAAAVMYLSEALREIDKGAVPSVYLYEALIANEHLRAKYFACTNWHNICRHYRNWLHLNDSGMVKINYAIALAYKGDTKEGLLLLTSLSNDKQLVKTHHVAAALAFVYALSGNVSASKECLLQAKQQGMSYKELRNLSKQIEQLSAN